MKYIKKKEFKFVAIAAILITIFTMGIVNAAETDVTKVENKGKSAIDDVFSLNINTIVNKTNTYCIQHHKPLRAASKPYVVDRYVEIDGKTAIVYKKSNSSGTEVKSKLNAVMAYIFNQEQGYGTIGNYTEGQKALWHYANKWVNALFGKNNDYYWSGNNGVSIEGNSVADAAKEYANNIGNTTSTSEQELSLEDKTRNKNKLNKINVGHGYYRVGPFKWKFEGTLKSIKVKADGNSVTDIKFIKYEGQEAKTIEVGEIKSGKEFYIDIKDAENITCSGVVVTSI